MLIELDLDREENPGTSAIATASPHDGHPFYNFHRRNVQSVARMTAELVFTGFLWIVEEGEKSPQAANFTESPHAAQSLCWDRLEPFACLFGSLSNSNFVQIGT
jgi:hypothetical protein